MPFKNANKGHAHAKIWTPTFQANAEHKKGIGHILHLAATPIHATLQHRIDDPVADSSREARHYFTTERE